MALAAQIRANLISPKYNQTTVTIVRQMSGRREKLYGVEEGHGPKNEVRKEKWIRKRIPKMTGLDWRMDNKMDVMPLVSGRIARIPDWSCAESQVPGAPSPIQDTERKEMLRLVQEIYDAALLVKKAKSIPVGKF